MATGKASGPGRDHCWRAGSSTGRVTVHRSKNQAQKNILRRWWQVAYYSRESSKPTTWRPQCQNSRVQRGYQTGALLIDCHPNHLLTNLHLRCRNTLSHRRCRHHLSKFPTKLAKEGRSRHAKIVKLDVAGPVSVLSKGLLSNLRRNVDASGSVALPARARDTCSKLSSIKVVRGAVVAWQALWHARRISGGGTPNRGSNW